MKATVTNALQFIEASLSCIVISLLMGQDLLAQDDGSDAYDNSASIAQVKLNKQYGYIDENGVEIIPASYYHLEYLDNGFFAAVRAFRDSLLIIDVDENVIHSYPAFHSFRPFRHGVSILTDSKSDGWIVDEEFGVVSELPHLGHGVSEYLSGFSKGGHALIDALECKGCASVSTGVVNAKGELVVDFWSHSNVPESVMQRPAINHELLVRYKDGKAGLVDMSGNEVLPFEYASIQIESDRLFAVTLPDEDGKTVYLNQSGEPVLDDSNFGFVRSWPQYGLLGYRDGDSNGILDQLGEHVIPAEYKSLRPISGDVIVAVRDSLDGLINRDNAVVVPFQFSREWTCPEQPQEFDSGWTLECVDPLPDSTEPLAIISSPERSRYLRYHNGYMFDIKPFAFEGVLFKWSPRGQTPRRYLVKDHGGVIDLTSYDEVKFTGSE